MKTATSWGFLLTPWPWPAPPLLAVGAMIVLAWFVGRGARSLRLPALLGFMLAGLMTGPSWLGLIGPELQTGLRFVSQIALAFIALVIGLELSYGTIRQQGSGLLLLVLVQSLAAFVLAGLGVLAVTGDWPTALIFAAIAPAIAPSTLGVVQEYRARGSLTKSLHAVVGFADGLVMLGFVFALATARALLEERQAAGAVVGRWVMLLAPLREILISLGVGLLLAIALALLLRHVGEDQGVSIVTFGLVLIGCGLCAMLHLSLILVHLLLGVVLINTQPPNLVERLQQHLVALVPVLVVLFFALAGANLALAALPALWPLLVVYMLGRAGGLLAGARLGAVLANLPNKIRDYLGLGILAQSGVAIGLALTARYELQSLGPAGQQVGVAVIACITTTCILFEIIGPLACRYALRRAGEIPG